MQNSQDFKIIYWVCKRRQNTYARKLYRTFCDDCSADRGYKYGNKKNSNSRCYSCAFSSRSKMVPKSAYGCKFCNSTHILPSQYGSSNDSMLWCKSNKSKNGGRWECRNKIRNKIQIRRSKEDYKVLRDAAYNRYSSKNKLKINISRLIYSKLKNRNLRKVNKTLDMLNFTIKELKDHLESQFQPGMTWNNYGAIWHLDHIIPDSWFKYISSEDENFKKSWALDNLQPMWATDNFSKGNRFAGGVPSRF